MELIYNISTNSCPILLFGETFYEQNKNKLKIFINNKEFKNYYFYPKTSSNNNNDNQLIVKIVIIGNIEYFAFMFHKCNNLLKISDISNLDTKNAKDMSYLFYKCES